MRKLLLFYSLVMDLSHTYFYIYDNFDLNMQNMEESSTLTFETQNTAAMDPKQSISTPQPVLPIGSLDLAGITIDRASDSPVRTRSFSRFPPQGVKVHYIVQLQLIKLPEI